MHEFTCTISEMKSFLGFLLFTGYHKLPQEKVYWSLDPDCKILMYSSEKRYERSCCEGDRL